MTIIILISSIFILTFLLSRTILKENEHLREEIKDWKLKEEANTKLWQNNYDKLKQHIYATDTKPNKNQ